MIGPILLVASWLLLRMEGRSLSAIGVDKPRLRAKQFGLGFLVAALVAIIQQVGTAWSAGVAYQLNPFADLAMVGQGARWNLNSVLYEELLFRGYLLYQLVKRLGPWQACLLGATAFGIYHWFSYELLGNPIGMLYIFLLTGAFGVMLSVAFVWTGSLAAPIGLHLGWNLTSYLVFSGGPFGPGFWVPAHGAPQPQPATLLASVILSILLPLLMVGGVSGFLTRKSPMLDRNTGPAA